MIDGIQLNGEPKDALWCDTGPDCGMPYTSDDRPYTDKGCCYDVCVDFNGKSKQRGSLKDRSGATVSSPFDG